MTRLPYHNKNKRKTARMDTGRKPCYLMATSEEDVVCLTTYCYAEAG